MYEESFDRRLGALLLADAAGAIPEGTSIAGRTDAWGIGPEYFDLRRS